MITYDEALHSSFGEDFLRAGAGWVDRGFELGEQLATLAVVLRLAESVCAVIISRAPEEAIEDGIRALIEDFEAAVRDRIPVVRELRSILGERDV